MYKRQLNVTVFTHLLKNPLETARILERSVYVDNFPNSLETEDEVIKYYHESKDMMKSAGFNLRSFSSNSEAMMKLAREDKVEEKKQNISVLGMNWNIPDDKLSLNFKSFDVPRFKPEITDAMPSHVPISEESEMSAKTILDEFEVPDVVTKRDVLKVIGKIFDPLGLFGPVTMRAKYFLQNLWRLKSNWDEPIPKSTENEWENIINDLNKLSTVEITRHLNYDPKERVEIHIFCDASKKCYSATCYLKSRGDVNLLFSRNRLAPIKEETIPRLELLGAVIAVRVSNHVSSTLKPVADNVKINYWCDSQVVLHWINSTKKLTEFVTNRILEILQTN